MSATKKTAKRLLKLIVDEVSLVDHPANDVETLLYKRVDVSPTKESAPVKDAASTEEAASQDRLEKLRKLAGLPAPLAKATETVSYDRENVMKMLRSIG